jgi:hypothetical protein
MPSLTFEIANALLNARMIKDGVETIALEDVIAHCLPSIPAKSKKKVHWLDPRETSDGPLCGYAGKSPTVTPDKGAVTCRRCRGMYLFDGEESSY